MGASQRVDRPAQAANAFSSCLWATQSAVCGVKVEVLHLPKYYAGYYKCIDKEARTTKFIEVLTGK
jgi:hypothetical protein